MSYPRFLIHTFLFFICMTDIVCAQDWANLARYQKENAAVPSGSPNDKRVVFMGNSITEGWKETCPYFFKGNSYINRGISGQTTPQMLLRFRQDVVALKPAAVIILAGINDIAGNTGPSTLEMIMDNIISMALLAKENNITPILCSVLPAFDFPWRPGMQPADKVVALNKMIETYAEQNNIIYVDYHSAMKDERNGLKAELTYDGVHCTEAGYKVMMPLAEAAIKKALDGK